MDEPPHDEELLVNATAHPSLVSAVLLLLAALLSISLSGCASFRPEDPPRVNVVGIEPATGAGMEIRFNIKLRLQNPNETPVEYDGIALELQLNGKPFANGVSSQKGSVPRFSEALFSVPVSVSAFAVIRQALGLADGASLENLPYVLNGKFGGSMLGGIRFADKGTLSLPGQSQTAK